jgi:hypothetical protein
MTHVTHALRTSRASSRRDESPTRSASRHPPCIWDPAEHCPVECQCHGHAYCKKRPHGVGRPIVKQEVTAMQMIEFWIVRKGEDV